jgi:hypothetical protein
LPLPGKIGKDRKIDCYYTKKPSVVKKISVFPEGIFPFDRENPDTGRIIN